MLTIYYPFNDFIQKEVRPIKKPTFEEWLKKIKNQFPIQEIKENNYIT